MFLVEKAILSSHFKSTTKNSQSHLIKSYQLAAISLDQKISHHLKTIPATSSSSPVSLNYLSSLISFLTSLHTECESQISNVKENDHDDEMLGLYMQYSLKVLDLCNLMTSSVQKLTEKRMLFNFGVKLLMMNNKCQVVQVEKMNKAKDVFGRVVNGLTESSPEKVTDLPECSPEKGKSAKKLIDELKVMVGRIPEFKTMKNGRDLVARAFQALGLLTVVIGDVLVSALFGDDSERVKVRIPAEFMWCDSFNEFQKLIFEQMKVNGNKVLEVDDVAKQAVIVRELIDNVTEDAEGRVKLVEGVKEMEMKVKMFSDGVDALNNGVNNLFRTVLKTRNGRLDVKF